MKKVHWGGAYSIRVTCRNCGDENRVEIPRGQVIDATSCPTCGCPTLAKAFMASGHPLVTPSSEER